MLGNASTYLVLATVLFVGLLAAAFDLFRLMRRTLGSLDSVAESAGRIVAGDSSARAISRDGCPADMSRFIEDFNTMAVQLKHTTSSNAAADSTGGGSGSEIHDPLAALETRLEEIKGLAAEADAESREALLHRIDGLFRFVDDLRLAEQPDTPAIRTLPRERSADYGANRK
ncbi:histidine kinase [Burkholderia theae]|uniref:histidine kinase n=1 Tax=Burkholderia theae TaxID=3143496 RepID=UPI003AFADC90